MKNDTIDMTMVQRSIKILAVTPSIPAGPWLFFYSVWTFIQNNKFQTLTEGEAQAKLGQFPNMEVTVYKLEGSDTHAFNTKKAEKRHDGNGHERRTSWRSYPRKNFRKGE